MKKDSLRKKSPHSSQKIERDLQERVKELTCLYDISSELESGKTLRAVFIAITRHIIIGMQFPKHSRAAILLDNEQFCFEEFPRRKIRRTLAATISVSGHSRGKIEVHYMTDVDFLLEEEHMVKEIGRALSRYIEKYELQKELKSYLGNLKTAIHTKTKQLEKSEKRYEDLFENAPDGIVISNPKGDIVKANRAFYQMLQYPEDGSVKLNLVRNHLYQNIQRIRPFIFKELKKCGHVDSVEMTLIDSKGNSCPVIGSFNFVEFDRKKHIEAIYKDIRLRKELEQRLIEQNENLERIVRLRTEDLENQKNLLINKNQELVKLAEQLKESSNKLQTLFNAITDAVVMIDADYNVKMSNKKGKTAAAHCYETIFHRDHPCENCPAVLVFQQKKAMTQETKKDNDVYLLQAYPICNDEGDVEGVLEFSRRITKQKTMEMQLIQTDKLVALGQLVSGIAHEINNPNTFLQGNILIIQEALRDIIPMLDGIFKNTPEMKIARLNYDIFRKSIPTLIDDMAQGTSRIKNIVDGLRKFARRDDGIFSDKVQINPIIETCLRLAANQIGRKAQVKLNLGANLPTFKGNAQRLEQVIVNILINASQAIEGEKGVISISTAFLEKKKRIEVVIRDNGVGMDENTMKQIFDPFFTTKRNSGGTGLGLSVAYGIIREHHGQIKVESQVRVGTTFTMQLPVNGEINS